MMDIAPLRERAIVLMREALELLDEAGESDAAIHLQWAHDIAARVPPMREGGEIDFGPNPDAVGDAPPPRESADPVLASIPKNGAGGGRGAKMPGGCPPPFDRAEDGMADTEQPDGVAADPALLRAMGGALAVFATLMARKGIAPLDEIANLLGIYAVVTGETAPDEGLIPHILQVSR